MTLRDPDDLAEKQAALEERIERVHGARKDLVARAGGLARDLRGRFVQQPDFKAAAGRIASARRRLTYRNVLLAIRVDIRRRIRRLLRGK